jgi:hypothetical protein
MRTPENTPASASHWSPFSARGSVTRASFADAPDGAQLPDTGPDGRRLPDVAALAGQPLETLVRDELRGPVSELVRQVVVECSCASS